MWLTIGAVVGSALAAFKIGLKLTTGQFDISRANVKGKTVLVTGSSAGIGYEAALALAGAGARVVMACRSLPKAERCKAQILREHPRADVHILQLDLCSLESVRSAAKEYKSWGWPLHVLVNNAGISSASTLVRTADGLEQSMQSNHFGHFLFTNLLMDNLKQSAPSRVVNVSSRAHTRGAFDLSNINSDDKYLGQLTTYSNTKLANVLFTRELARRLQGTGVTTNCLHPGVVATDFFNRFPIILQALFIYPALFFFKSSKEGAQTTLYLACDKSVEHVSGHYFSDCKPATMHFDALSDKNCDDLWKVSEKLTKMT